MQLIELVCKDKHLRFKEHSRQYFELVSDNLDYSVHIDMQDEYDNAMFFRIVFPNKEWREIIVSADGIVEIPLWALQFRLIQVGITVGDEYASTPLRMAVRKSIKSISGDYEIPDTDESSWSDTTSIEADVVNEHLVLNITDFDDGDFTTQNEQLVADMTNVKGVTFSIQNERLVATV